MDFPKTACDNLPKIYNVLQQLLSHLFKQFQLYPERKLELNSFSRNFRVNLKIAIFFRWNLSNEANTTHSLPGDKR